MAGFRTFATGEVLTAANVNNFLMKQSVMVFADATARTTALGAEVTEGMLTFNLDTGALEVFDGTNFVAASAEPNLVEVKTALKTDTFSASIAAAGSASITGLSITHAAADATNKFVLIAYVGMISTGNNTQAIALHDGTNLIGIGDASGVRPRIAAGGINRSDFSIENSQNLAIHIVYTPGDTSSRTFSIHAINNSFPNPDVVFVNRSEDDRNLLNFSRGSSSLTLMEVKV